MFLASEKPPVPYPGVFRGESRRSVPLSRHHNTGHPCQLPSRIGCMSEFITIREAADLLDASTQRVRQLRSTGTLTAGGGSAFETQTVSRTDTLRLARLQRARAINRIGDLTAYAMELRTVLHPSTAARLAVMRAGGQPISLSPSAARTANLVFGRAAMRRAAQDAGPCAWCWSHMAHRVLGEPDPTNGPEWCALFASAPCPRDVTRWEETAARVQGARREAVRASLTASLSVQEDRSRRAVAAVMHGRVGDAERILDGLQ